MLQPRLTTCLECTDIPTLLCKIDCKLAELGRTLYANLVFMLNNSISASDVIDLLHYRRILTFRQVNADYCVDYTIDYIASKVNRLTVGAICRGCSGVDDYVRITSTTSTTSTTQAPLPD